MASCYSTLSMTTALSWCSYYETVVDACRTSAAQTVLAVVKQGKYKGINNYYNVGTNTGKRLV